MILAANLPALQVVVPLLAAPICALLPRANIAWLFAFITCVVSGICSYELLQQVTISGDITYAMGGWLPPVGIEYRVDRLSAYMLLLVSAIAIITLLFAYRSVEKEIPAEKHTTFYAVFLLCFAGLLGIVITNDAFNIYVFLEISSLAMYALIAMGGNRKSLLASFEYLILGTIGATLYLIGVGLLYMKTGSLNITDLAQLVPPLADSPVIKMAFAFLTLGLALKIALFPLHLWLTNAYSYAPSFISAFLSATATKVGIYVIIRLIFMLFGIEFSIEIMPFDQILLTLGGVAIVIGSLVAIYQENIKRMLAFSSVAQVGYIMLGIALASQAGLTASLTHIANHAVAKSALFMVLGCVMYRTADVRLDDFKGLGKTMPWTMMAFVIAGLSLIGVPGTAGFISKWYLFIALMEQGLWVLLAVLLVGSILAIIYVWRVVEVAYFTEAPVHNTDKAVPYSMQCALWVTVVACIILGFYTEPTVGLASPIATMLVGGEV